MDQKTCYLQNLEEIQKTGKKFIKPLATLTSVKSSQINTQLKLLLESKNYLLLYFAIFYCEASIK